MKRLLVAAVAAFLAFGANSASAIEMTTIHYGLSGTVFIQATPTIAFTRPVFEFGTSHPDAAHDPKGSMVTFRFTTFFNGAIIHPFGPADMLTFNMSIGQVVPGAGTGYKLSYLTGPPLKGFRQFGGNVTPAGYTIGYGQGNGFFHCTASPQFCAKDFGVQTYYQSAKLGLGYNGPEAPSIYWYPSNSPTAVPLPFRGLGAYQTPQPGILPPLPPGPITRSGTWLVTIQGALIGSRPFCLSTSMGARNGTAGLCTGLTGTIILQGTEIGRTVVPIDRPRHRFARDDDD